jgi:hypothetical protein
MASQRLPDNNDDLFSLGDDAVDGAHEYEATLPLKQNTEAAIDGDLDAARQKQAAFKAADTALGDAQTAVRVADSNVKAFLPKFKKSMTAALGDDWQTVFGEAGFDEGSLALPTTQDGRFAMIQKLPAFLTKYPDCQDARPKVNVTPAAATALYNALNLARGASNKKEEEYGTAITARDTAVKVLRTRLTGLIGELGQLIEDDSPVWYAFGLNAPADPATPGAPLTTPSVTPGAPKTAYSVWGIARRADRYYVYAQIVGTDAAPKRIATVTDRAYTFTDLPSGKTVKVSISGVNDAGEGPQSPQVEVVVP